MVVDHFGPALIDRAGVTQGGHGARGNIHEPGGFSLAINSLSLVPLFLSLCRFVWTERESSHPLSLTPRDILHIIYIHTYII